MPIWLAILSIAQGLSQSYHGDRAGGFANMFNAFQSFGNRTNSFNVNSFPKYDYHSFGETDVGARRNFM